MASIARDKNGTRRILFVAPDGRRPTIRLGKVSQRAAESIKFRVEQLLEALHLNRPMEADLAQWVTDLEPRLAKRLAAVGLIHNPEAKAAATLGEHLDSYFARRTDVKPGTLVHWRHTKRCLVEFFGAEKPIDAITAGEARDFERWLRTGEARANQYADNKAEDGLAANTARKRISNAKQFFQDAVERELLARNPFAGLKGAVGGNRERDFFVTREAAEKVLESCPDAEWRLLFALSRFGGLRCPSEHLALTWADVNWAEGRLTVRSPKTERHEGKGVRQVPIFPELRPHLEQVWEQAQSGATFVITRYRDPNQNLRTQFERIIGKAGLTPWPKLFQNLRASRATELANEYPAHVAAAWLGHSTLIAQRHYWQVTSEDFQRATGGQVAHPTVTAETSQGTSPAAATEMTSCQSAQKAAQHAHAATRNESQSTTPAHEKTPDLPVFAESGDTMQSGAMGGTGLEPVTSTV